MEELRKKREVLKLLTKNLELMNLNQLLALIKRFNGGVELNSLAELVNISPELMLREILFLERTGKVRLTKEGKVIYRKA
ncbi:MAG: hypothetical protein QW507_02805 [Candidatus Nanoarchaeia archaeon]|nr:hypothetical protein [Candidatus Haiyanarchaeum thermophilum]MCW1303311.1 hypothetical protein [Candidatus Haiyanarchaeum thermophilum]MCW1306469.1 hypothetical protein [Candidatus Haiyanarchaeum thermophilum]MCW1307233.1 hypothetical protein [Candidatus Haiyanarchaeum thermophilum]MCW1308099.1 hypothetical protein [Candidatus Haiyanarchaeum thermophilum]